MKKCYVRKKTSLEFTSSNTVGHIWCFVMKSNCLSICFYCPELKRFKSCPTAVLADVYKLYSHHIDIAECNSGHDVLHTCTTQHSSAQVIIFSGLWVTLKWFIPVMFINQSYFTQSVIHNHTLIGAPSQQVYWLNGPFNMWWCMIDCMKYNG